MAAAWIWDDTRKLYIYATSGRKVPLKYLMKYRDAMADAASAEIEALSNRLFSNLISPAEWNAAVKGILRKLYVAEYELALGGKNNMLPADYGRIGAMLKSQYEFLRQFTAEISVGKLSPAQILARARQYANSAVQAFERAKAVGQGLTGSYSLPAYPGDGQTQCRANCRCHWEIDKRGATVLATWTLGVAEHCEDCVSNSILWSPLVIEVSYA